MIHKMLHYEKLDVHKDFLLPNIESQRLEEILSDIEKQKSFRIFGYILMPIIIGFFILKKLNDRILVLTQNKDVLTKRVISLKQKKEIFDKYFNDVIETSINEVIASRITIENFNKELVERRKKEYDFLFQKSTVGLNDEQKTAIITDDKHNLVVAGAGSGKTEVLITRIAYLVLRKQEKIAPERILALAFQNKAGIEIEERLRKKFGIEVKIKTFHSFGNEVLSKPKLKFDTDNEYHEFIAELYKNAEKEPAFQNKLLAYILQNG
jgi:predicted nucleic acid-binding protein